MSILQQTIANFKAILLLLSKL